MTNNHVWTGPAKAAECMHPDLRWLAENVSEWASQENLSIARKSPIGAEFYDPEHMPYGDGFTKTQWLQARKDLGLIMSDEEEEAMKRLGQKLSSDNPSALEYDPSDVALPRRYLYGEIKEGLDDMVNRPPHYQLREGYEVYDLRQDLAKKAAQASVPHDQYSDWDRALEYLLRMWDKNGLEDCRKGAWYVNKLIEKLEKDNDR